MSHASGPSAEIATGALSMTSRRLDDGIPHAEAPPIGFSRALVVRLKLLYLYLVYLTVGIDEEAYQIRKGTYLIELDSTAAAAKAFERALEGTNSPRVHAALGYCHLC